MSDFESMEAECPDCAFKDAEIERLQCVLAGRRVQQYKDEIERLQSDMDKYHEMVDLFIESLGNKGMSPADIVAEILDAALAGHCKSISVTLHEAAVERFGEGWLTGTVVRTKLARCLIRVDDVFGDSRVFVENYHDCRAGEPPAGTSSAGHAQGKGGDPA